MSCSMHALQRCVGRFNASGAAPFHPAPPLPPTFQPPLNRRRQQAMYANKDSISMLWRPDHGWYYNTIFTEGPATAKK
jgi:hypothetical protein